MAAPLHRCIRLVRYRNSLPQMATCCDESPRPRTWQAGGGDHTCHGGGHRDGPVTGVWEEMVCYVNPMIPLAGLRRKTRVIEERRVS